MKGNTAFGMAPMIAALLAALLATPVAAQPVSVGASMGMFFPVDRLTNHSDMRGANLAATPGTGLRFRWADGSETAWEWGADFVIFESDDDPDLRSMFIPVQLRYLVETTDVGGLALMIGAGAGVAFLTVNRGEEESDTMGLATVGIQLERSILNVTAALGFEVGMRYRGRDSGILLQTRLTLAPRLF
jgi:hypothetical protein